MKMKIHTRGFNGSAIRQKGEESSAMLGAILEIDGHLIEEVTRVRVLHAADDFTTVMVRFIPGEVETIAHSAETWAQIIEELRTSA